MNAPRTALSLACIAGLAASVRAQDLPRPDSKGAADSTCTTSCILTAVDGSILLTLPASVASGASISSTPQGFDERRGYSLTSAVTIDPTAGLATPQIPIGTSVNSHMIFLDSGGAIVTTSSTWCFCGRILGILSDQDGNLEHDSNSQLSAAAAGCSTVYPAAFTYRGIEPSSGDGYRIRGNTLELSMHVIDPGDWIRVITAADSGSTGLTFSLRSASPTVGHADSRFGYIIGAADLLTVGNTSGAIRAPHPPALGAVAPEVIVEGSAWGLIAPSGGAIELDDFSFGHDSGNTWVFSVAQGALGCGAGAAGCTGPSAVYNRGYCTCGGGCAAGTTSCVAAPDIFRKRPTGGDTLLYNGRTQLGLVEVAGSGTDDDVDGLDADTTAADLSGNIYFTLDAATAAANGYSGADILVAKPCTSGLTIYASVAQLGLLPTDDIAGLALQDDGDGLFDPNVDVVYFTLWATSPTVMTHRHTCGTATAPEITQGDILTVCALGASFPRIVVRAGSLGVSAVNPVDQVDAIDLISGDGAAFCYANCDQSTTQPALNVLDFACFLNAFAAGDEYANCDGSTTQPALNVLDFACFLNSFAAGCS